MKQRLLLITLATLLISCQTPSPTHTDQQEQETVSEQQNTLGNDTMPKVTGIGGIFFRSKDPAAVSEWYGKNLGLAIGEYGTPFEFRNANRPEETNYLIWTPFPENTPYFNPSEKEFMINYRVQNLDGLMKQLVANGVTVLDEVALYDYGKFVHIMDLEGNKIELWEPNDSHLTTLGRPTTK